MQYNDIRNAICEMDWKRLLRLGQNAICEVDWKLLLGLGRNEVLGLDIGSSSVKIIQLRKDESGYVVTAAGKVEIESDICKPSQNSTPNADGSESDKTVKELNTIDAISQCLQSTGVETNLAVCGVCGPEVAVRYFKFPALLPEEIEGAVLLEAGQVCPFNVDDSTVDYQLIADGEDNACGVLVATTNKLIEAKRQLTKEACLDAVLMDVDGLALLNCFSEYEKYLPEPETGRTIAVLNVGNSFTNLAIIGENSLPFIRDIACAGETIVKEIAAENKVSGETVAKLLFGHEDGGEVQLELSSNLARACSKLIIDVTNTLRYYTTQEKSAVVEKIFVCGGFALVPGFVELLNDRFAAEVLLWNPFDKIRCDTGDDCRDILQKNGPEMAVAAGFAMRSI